MDQRDTASHYNLNNGSLTENTKSPVGSKSPRTPAEFPSKSEYNDSLMPSFLAFSYYPSTEKMISFMRVCFFFSPEKINFPENANVIFPVR